MTRLGLSRFNAAATDISEALFGETIVFRDQSFEAAVSQPTTGGELSLGIESVESILKIRIRKLFAHEKPRHGKETLTFQGEEWRIDEVTDDRLGSAWLLTCLPAARK